VSACRDLEDYGISCVVRGCPLLAKLNMAHSRYVSFVCNACGVVRAVLCGDMWGRVGDARLSADTRAGSWWRPPTVLLP
jgi:hypothetical protein